MRKQQPLSRNLNESRGYLTAAEVGEILGLTTSWIYKLALKKKIGSEKIGRYRRFYPEAIHNYCESLFTNHPKPSSKKKRGVR